MLNYHFIIVQKVPFPVLSHLKWRNFSSTCSTSPIIVKFYQQVRSIKRSKLAKFRDNIIFIDGVMMSQIIRHDVKIWWRHTSVNNFGIAMKLCILVDLVVAIICRKFCEFSLSRSWFTEIASFTDAVYLWRHWRLLMTYCKRHGLKFFLVLNKKS